MPFLPCLNPSFARWWQAALFLVLAWPVRAAVPLLEQDPANKMVTLADAARSLVLRLDYDGKCVLDQVRVQGREVLAKGAGVASAIQVQGQWHTTRSNLPTPQVELGGDTLVVRQILFGGGGVNVAETWRFTVGAESIRWGIERTYLSGGTVEDTGMATWDFADLTTWTGALLGTGGVAWTKFLDQPNATYGAHTGPVLFWSRDHRSSLRIMPEVPDREQMAVRFSRQPDGRLTLTQSVTRQELSPKQALNRFRPDRQDLWASFVVEPGEVHVEYTLSGVPDRQVFDRGHFPGLPGDSIGEVLNTIARVGVVDRRFHGSNNWRLGYAVLHEPWIAQLGLAIDDPFYTAGVAETLDYQRDHAIDDEGRVKSRWCYDAGDALPGTYDSLGFYETQWGHLMDSQPSFVLNVCDQFDLSGDREWVHGQKAVCERVLNYLLRRDADGDGLLECQNERIAEKKSSDWIDVVWASHENAFINAQMFAALAAWSDVEELLGDQPRAAKYRTAAARLKDRFNQPTSAGGFWLPNQGFYAYWRDQDDSVHGTNLVVPVNFMAIAYGVCDAPDRRAAILDRIESRMQQEGLFFWPLCFDSYAPGEAHPSQFPFPTYENGDLFLAWGEVGTRAYAPSHPELALKYIRKVLERYEQDGLAFQRYTRAAQTGAGNDILANNANPVVGLYRNIYGLQPKYNRLQLAPHLAPELEGTQLNYWLRGQIYRINLQHHEARVAVRGCTFAARHPFGLNASHDALDYFHGADSTPALSVSRPAGAPLEVRIGSWKNTPAGPRQWTERSPSGETRLQHSIGGLKPNSDYALQSNTGLVRTLRTDAAGRAGFEQAVSAEQSFTLQSVSQESSPP